MSGEMRSTSARSDQSAQSWTPASRLPAFWPFLAVLGLFLSLMTYAAIYSSWENRQPEWQLRRAVLDTDVVRVEQLLSEGAPVNRILAGSTVLHHAAWAGKSEIVRLLLDHGADPNIRSTPSGETALHAATRGNRPEIVSLLLQAGAHPWMELLADSEQCVTGIVYPVGASPEDIARQGGYDRVLALLLQP